MAEPGLSMHVKSWVQSLVPPLEAGGERSEWGKITV